MSPSVEGKRQDGSGQETPTASDDAHCQATVTSIRAMLAAPQHASEPTPLAALNGTAREAPRSRHRSYSSAMGVPRGNIPPHLDGHLSTSTPPMRRRRRRRQRKVPLWRRFRSLLMRCWSFVCFSRSNSADEHVRVRIRRDNGRTVVKTKLVGEAGFFAFDDDDDEDDNETEEEAWEEWEPHISDARYISGPPVHRWSTASPNASLGSFAKSNAHPQAVAGGLADCAAELYDEVDNVMHVFAKVLETIPVELSAQYLFTGLIGYGGNGFIAGALDRQTGAAVAVKFISKDRVPKGSLMISDAFSGVIPVEAEILRIVHHPNIVGFHALHVDEHFFMIVMEQVTNFLKTSIDDSGAPALRPVSTEETAILSIRSFGSADSIPLTQRQSITAPLPRPAQPARHPSRGSVQSRQLELGSLPRALSSSSSAQSPAVKAQLAAPSDTAERIPSVSRPSPIRSNTNGSIPLRVPPSLPPPRQTNGKPSSPPLPQPTLSNLTRPRHGHPGDLDEFLYMYGPLHPLIQRRLCKQLISAYAHLANAGIAYLDFRGENIIVDREFSVRLVDFGMSQFLDSPSVDAPQRRRRWIARDSQQQQQQQRFAVYGTRPFSAPEILTGNGYLGPEADIWALGIIFYLIATGGIDPFASVEHILSRSSTQLGWPAGCTVAGAQKELIERMLARLPEDRPTVAEVCASEWLSDRTADDMAP
ncbi:hypothetical protein HDU86_000670 [Geranomyces michiganensis]|nr:hypothetical protein HDU86_000670 [Geranomyces michiganensis]